MKIKYILISVAVPVLTLLLITSCKKELGYIPESYLSPEQVYADEPGSIAGITGIYRQFELLKNGELGLIGTIGTDEGKTSQFVPTWGGYWLKLSAISSYDKTQLTAQNDVLNYFWERVYQAIGNANIAIRYIEKGPASQAVKTRLLGEAKFLRAMGYFYLVQLWGDVPMPTDEANANNDENGYPRTSATEVYKLIVNDLKYAQENLPDKSKMEKGRANKQAAQTLLGKVYLTLKDYPNAKTTLEPLMNTSESRLMDNYADLFKNDESTENNIESLFEFQYSTESGYTQGLSSILGSWNIVSTQPGGGGQAALPTPYAAKIYPLEDSIRKDASLRSIYYDGNGNPGYNDWWGDVGKPHLKKYEQKPNQSASASSRNIYYLRYADAVLMYAETLNELDHTTDALIYLNKVRTRAKIQNLEQVIGATPTKDQFRDSLVTERIKELMFEGWRWFDLKRWGLLVDRTKLYNTESTNNIVAPKNLLLPIPYNELMTNKAIQNQNAGY